MDTRKTVSDSGHFGLWRSGFRGRRRGRDYVVRDRIHPARQPDTGDHDMFIIFIAFIALFILLVCVVAIVMSTTHGSNWLQGLWERRPGDD